LFKLALYTLGVARSLSLFSLLLWTFEKKEKRREKKKGGRVKEEKT